MKSTAFTIILVILFSSLLLSCNENKEIDISKELPKHIYTGGFETLGNIAQAKLWKDNNLALTLADQAVATAIAISGSDVYIAGYANAPAAPTGETHVRAVYWKNGNPVYLTEGVTSAEATDIAVVGNDVYVAGSEYNSKNIQVAKYWKNGISVNLSSGVNRAVANGIVVNNNDVYVCGSEVTGDKNIVKYWRNGVSISLSANSGFAGDIAVSGSDIYVAGYEILAGNLHSIARYWKNGKTVDLSDGAKSASAKRICINNNTVYIVGFDGEKAVLWKNGQPTYLSDRGIASDVCVDENDIYVAGTVNINNRFVAQYWKNDQSTTLSNNSSLATCIAVSP